MILKCNFCFFLLTSLTEKCIAYSKILKLIPIESEIYCGATFKEMSTYSTKLDYFVGVKDSEDYFEDCLLKVRSRGRSVTLLNQQDLYSCTVRILRPYVQADIIIFFPELNIELFRRPIHKLYVIPHNILINVIITTKNATFTCNNGVFRPDVFKSIEEVLNILWHKYGVYYIIAEFPFVCPGYYIIFEGKKPSGMTLYDRTIVSVPANSTKELMDRLNNDRRALTYGYPLRANIFKRFSTSITQCSNMHYYWKAEDDSITKGWCGMDVLIMHDILNYFKFNVTFPDVDNEVGYGYVNAYTGSATGSLGYLLQNIVDISFNSRFIVKYVDDDLIQFLHYVTTDSVCVVLKNPSKVPLWHYAFNCFGPLAWITLLFTFGAAGMTAKGLIILRKKILGQEEQYSFELIFAFISLSFTGIYLNKRVPVSILGGMCLLISVTMLSLYQGNVNYMYTNSLKYNKVQRLSELPEHGIQIYTSTSMLDTLGKLEDTSAFVLQSVNKSDLLTNGKIAVLQRQADMRLEIIQNYSDDNGRPLFYIVNECFSNYFLSYVARKDFPFGLEVKRFITHLLQAGLPETYYRWTRNALHLSTRPKKIINLDTELRPFSPSTLSEHRVAFGLLLVGYLTSTAAFVIEAWWAKKGRNCRYL